MREGSVEPFFMPLRQHSTLYAHYVANPPFRRNNSMKNLRNSLESAEIRRTFATSKVEVSFLFHNNVIKFWFISNTRLAGMRALYALRKLINVQQELLHQ